MTPLGDQGCKRHPFGSQNSAGVIFPWCLIHASRQVCRELRRKLLLKNVYNEFNISLCHFFLIIIIFNKSNNSKIYQHHYLNPHIYRTIHWCYYGSCCCCCLIYPKLLPKRSVARWRIKSPAKFDRFHTSLPRLTTKVSKLHNWSCVRWIHPNP